MITEPGVYDIPEDEYHEDPIEGGSLSSTGARMLLPPSCPALFRHRTAYPTYRDEFDFGTAAHRLVLDNGPEIEVVGAYDWRTKAAKEARDKARAEGKVPLLEDDYARVQAMAAAIKEHPEASELLDPSTGKAEQTLVWRDDRTGIWRRARLDYLKYDGDHVTIVDYKTTRSANPGAISKSIYEYGYHQQQEWYTDGLLTLGAQDVEFRFIFQEKSAPYLVTVVRLDPDAVLWGGVLNRKAIDVYQRCVLTGEWPGYTDKCLELSLPGYALAQYERADERGDYYVSEVPF